jgi:hypothetical protein
MTTWQIWAIVGASSFVALAILMILWLRMPVYHWYCRRCRKVVGAGRMYPRKCSCGSGVLVAYYCKTCGGWNTLPTANWRCGKCSSQAMILGVEYHIDRGLWRWRNRAAEGRIAR